MNKPSELSDEQMQKAIEWLKHRLPKFTCECCGKNDWAVANQLIVSYIFNVPPLQQRSVYPSVMITCKNCANVKLFNAVMMGIVD